VPLEIVRGGLGIAGRLYPGFVQAVIQLQPSAGQDILQHFAAPLTGEDYL
jgi:hypothetical protein